MNCYIPLGVYLHKYTFFNLKEEEEDKKQQLQQHRNNVIEMKSFGHQVYLLIHHFTAHMNTTFFEFIWFLR